jgi:hypothetical protein
MDSSYIQGIKKDDTIVKDKQMTDTGKFSLAESDINPIRVEFIHKIQRHPFVAPYLKEVTFTFLYCLAFP